MWRPWKGSGKLLGGHWCLLGVLGSGSGLLEGTEEFWVLTGGTDAGSWHLQWQHWATTAGSGGCAAVTYAWCVPQTRDLPTASTLGSPHSFVPFQTPTVGVPQSYSLSTPFWGNPLALYTRFGDISLPSCHIFELSPFSWSSNTSFHLKINVGVPIASSILSWGRSSFRTLTVLGIPPSTPF